MVGEQGVGLVPGEVPVVEGARILLGRPGQVGWLGTLAGGQTCAGRLAEEPGLEGGCKAEA